MPLKILIFNHFLSFFFIYSVLILVPFFSSWFSFLFFTLSLNFLSPFYSSSWQTHTPADTYTRAHWLPFSSAPFSLFLEYFISRDYLSQRTTTPYHTIFIKESIKDKRPLPSTFRKVSFLFAYPLKRAALPCRHSTEWKIHLALPVISLHRVTHSNSWWYFGGGLFCKRQSWVWNSRLFQWRFQVGRYISWLEVTALSRNCVKHVSRCHVFGRQLVEFTATTEK